MFEEAQVREGKRVPSHRRGRKSARETRSARATAIEHTRERVRKTGEGKYRTCIASRCISLVATRVSRRALARASASAASARGDGGAAARGGGAGDSVTLSLIHI